MAKRLIKKSTINKIVKLFFTKPKKSRRLPEAEAGFLDAIFDDTLENVNIGDQFGESQYPTLDAGNTTIEVCGTMRSQTLMEKIYQKYHTKRIRLTLTPICDYQIQKKWPEPPFVNVNLFGSQSTELTNWIGYVEIKDPYDIDLESIVSEVGNVNVYASVHQRDDYCITKLHLSNKYKYNDGRFVETYISHDKQQIVDITNIACETGGNYIQVGIKKNPDQKHYDFLYNKKTIGGATVKKIDSCLKGKEIHKAFVKITKFRFDDELDNKHYSKLVIITK